MVQRKVQEKLGIQANIVLKHDQYQKSLKKPPSYHHQDGKTRGPEVKKKMMKRSRSLKLSEIGQQTLKSSSSSSPKTTPPPTQHALKSLETSPNYMKPTTSSDARKELRSKPTKASSLARSLTKTPSFKPSRAGSLTEKCPRVALCASPELANAQRATCSSTLKDSKFPSHLMLSHGGTESDGASSVKVCPYTYCSLNGHLHNHASLPPLKSFLSAKRRALRTQKIPKPEIDEAEDRVGIDLFTQNYAEAEEERDVSEGSPQLPETEAISGEEASDMEIKPDETELFRDGDDRFEDLSGEEDEETAIVDDETSIEETEVVVGGVSEAEEDTMSRDVATHEEDRNDQVCDIASQKTNEDDEAGDDQASEKTEDSSERVDTTFDSSSAKDTDSVETSAKNQTIDISICDDRNDDASETGHGNKCEKQSEEGENEDEEERKKWERSKREARDSEGDSAREFNPREPNYLPPAAEEEGEKVDLKHQEMEERKNSEEWMIDRALQQTVTKLGAARKRRVALLVEAFETVTPITERLSHHHHYQYHPPPPSPVWNMRPIQACN